MNCKNCGSKISRKSDKCEICGSEVKKSSFFKKNDEFKSLQQSNKVTYTSNEIKPITNSEEITKTVSTTTVEDSKQINSEILDDNIELENVDSEVTQTQDDTDKKDKKDKKRKINQTNQSYLPYDAITHGYNRLRDKDIGVRANYIGKTTTYFGWLFGFLLWPLAIYGIIVSKKYKKKHNDRPKLLLFCRIGLVMCILNIVALTYSVIQKRELYGTYVCYDFETGEYAGDLDIGNKLEWNNPLTDIYLDGSLDIDEYEDLPDDVDYRSFHLGYYLSRKTEYYDEEFQLDLMVDNEDEPREIYVFNYMNEDDYYCIEEE